MATKTVFDDWLTSSGRITANSRAELLGPGRLGRCQEVQITIHFAANCTAGAAVVEQFYDQSLSGVAKTISTINAPGAGNETEGVHLTGIRGFLSVRANGTINGDGIHVWARGN